MGGCGDRWHRRRSDRPCRSPPAGLAAGTGRAGAGRRAGPSRLGGIPRGCHGRCRAAAGDATVRAGLVDQPVRLCPRDRGVCAGDRRAGALPGQRPGTIAGLPARSELLGGTGQLESTVSDEAVLAAARRLRILPAASATRANGSAGAVTDLLRAARAGNQQAGDLLAERARVLGESVALLRDLLNPDELVVGGQAFTEYPEGMEQVEKAFAACSVLPPRDIRVTAFGNRVQEAGAGIVSLGGLYADPLGAMRRAGALDTRLPDTEPGRSLSAAYARAWA
ncbi:hypothetical protein I547_1788 [Mycobacterium kansasii 824]|nr:hypothetical protein I547_1788 [Mycobacterium kansasii 824]